MTGNPQFISPDDERWRAYLSTNRQATIFHHPAWSHLLADCYSYDPLVFVAFDSGGQIRGAIPVIKIRSFLKRQRLVSLPFTDHCPPLYDDFPTLKLLTEQIASLPQQHRIAQVELRSNYSVLPTNYSVSDFVLHQLELAPDESVVSRRIKPKHFRQVKVAHQRGVRIETGRDLTSVQQFYRLHTLTRRRKGVPVQPWRFFRLLSERIIERDLGFVLLAYEDHECIAGAVFLCWNKMLIYKYSASIEKAKRLLAMDLLLWTAIQWGCQNGYACMDMGRSENENEGLRCFKRRWGAEETTLPYYRISESLQKPTSHHWANKFKPLFQRSPLWVSRAAGELLYKHFG